MLSLAANRADNSGLPLYGIAACYATIPMLYGALTSGEPFKLFPAADPGPLRLWTPGPDIESRRRHLEKDQPRLHHKGLFAGDIPCYKQ